MRVAAVLVLSGMLMGCGAERQAGKWHSIAATDGYTIWQMDDTQEFLIHAPSNNLADTIADTELGCEGRKDITCSVEHNGVIISVERYIQ